MICQLCRGEFQPSPPTATLCRYCERSSYPEKLNVAWTELVKFYGKDGKLPSADEQKLLHEKVVAFSHLHGMTHANQELRDLHAKVEQTERSLQYRRDDAAKKIGEILGIEENLSRRARTAEENHRVISDHYMVMQALGGLTVEQLRQTLRVVRRYIKGLSPQE